MSDIVIGIGDGLPEVNATLSWPQGGLLPVDLSTNQPAVRFYFQQADGNGPVFGGACSITDAGARKVRYEWAATDTREPGDYEAWFVVTWGTGQGIAGKPMTCPNPERLSMVISGRKTAA